MIIQKEQEDLIQENLENYTSITKQTPKFIHQLVLVALLEEFIKSQKAQTKSNFLDFVKDRKEYWLKNLSKIELSLYDFIFNEITSEEKDLTKKFTIAARFGLIRNKHKNKTIYDDLYFEDIEITDVFYQIKNLCNGNYNEFYKYKRLVLKQLTLFTNKKNFLRLYVIEILFLLKKINFIKKEEIKIFHFLFDHSKDDIDSKIEQVANCIVYLREKCKINNSNFDDELSLLLSSNDELKEKIYTTYNKEDRLWQLMKDNFDFKYGLDLIYNDKEEMIYLSDCYNFNNEVTEYVKNLYNLDVFDFQNHLCTIKEQVNDKDIKIQQNKEKELKNENIFPFHINKFINDYNCDDYNKKTIFPQKFLYDSQDDDYLTSVCNHNILLISNPNSGKSVFVKETIVAPYEIENKPYYHKEISLEPGDFNLPGKLLIHRDINGTLIYGVLFQTCINAIVNFMTPHFNYFDEIGEHSFKELFGKLKNILKNNNRVNLSNIYQQFKEDTDKEEFINRLKKINSIETLNDFVEKYKKLIGKENILNLRIDNQDVSFFLPSNYVFIATSNNSPAINHSLKTSDGFAENGGRFKVIYFYQNINGYDFGLPVKDFIVKINQKTINILSNAEDDKKIDSDIRKQIGEVKNKCLLANFEKIKDGDVQGAKKIIILNIEEYTNINMDDIDFIVNEINRININE